MKLALLGAGQRGMIYAAYAYEKEQVEIVAVADIDEERRAIARDRFHIAEDCCFADADTFFAKGRMADALILASMDQAHFGQAMTALRVGYHILLEKPISPNPAECLALAAAAKEAGRIVTVCHVLRYTNFFMGIKSILASGELGRILTIQHAENIGNYHMAHSFVRGNWRNSDLSSPIIMQKSCHDMDILVWLTESRAKKISSFGELSYFVEKNAPKGSTKTCLTCPVAENCRFDAKKAYLPIAGDWPATVIGPDQSEEGLLEALKTSPYGRCVYRCDNNVCDHQVTNILFENGVTATFHLSAFTNRMHRTIKIMCENGDICGDDAENILRVTKYASNAQDAYETQEIHVGAAAGFHGGGDVGLMRDFLELLRKRGNGSRSDIAKSVESHLMACAAEQARLTGEVTDMEELRRRLQNG